MKLWNEGDELEGVCALQVATLEPPHFFTERWTTVVARVGGAGERQKAVATAGTCNSFGVLPGTCRGWKWSLLPRLLNICGADRTDYNITMNRLQPEGQTMQQVLAS